MKMFLLAALCLAPAFARADETPAPAKTAVPPETVKVTDEKDQPLFDRVRDTYLRAAKKGLLATAAPGTAAPESR